MQRFPSDLLAGLLSLPQQLTNSLRLPSLPPFPFSQTRSNGLSITPSGLGFQTVSVGSQTFESVGVRWTGQVRNTGNAPLSGATVRLQTLQAPSGPLIRESNTALPTLAPGASAPINLSTSILSTDPTGNFFGKLLVEQSGQVLGQVSSPVLGTINLPPVVASMTEQAWFDLTVQWVNQMKLLRTIVAGSWQTNPQYQPTVNSLAALAANMPCGVFHPDAIKLDVSAAWLYDAMALGEAYMTSQGYNMDGSVIRHYPPVPIC